MRDCRLLSTYERISLGSGVFFAIFWESPLPIALLLMFEFSGSWEATLVDEVFVDDSRLLSISRCCMRNKPSRQGCLCGWAVRPTEFSEIH